jgi:NMT1/THI5 like
LFDDNRTDSVAALRARISFEYLLLGVISTRLRLFRDRHQEAFSPKILVSITFMLTPLCETMRASSSTKEARVEPVLHWRNMMKYYSFLAGILLGSVGCAVYPLVPSARAADVVEVATVGNPNPIAWPGLIAEHAGMFAAEALQVKLLYVASSAQLVQQLAAGSLNVGGSTALVDTIRASHQGAPIALLRLEGQKAPFALVGKPTIKRIQDLRGKTVMIGGPKDITRFYLDRMLAPNGLKDADYELVYAGATPARYAALKSGAVDAVILFPPFNLLALAEGFSDLGGVVDYAPNLPFSRGSDQIARSATSSACTPATMSSSSTTSGG